jgi:formamidopyrimidine-DNA glycosylase
MPELPEVETTVRLLRPMLLGRSMGDVRVAWPRILGGQTAAEFQKQIRGTRVLAIDRRAKYILLRLERQGRCSGVIVVHLRMTGRLYVDPPGSGPEDHIQVEIELDNGHLLRFLDVRKFGRIQFAQNESNILPVLGPEPLSDDFQPRWLVQSLKRHRRQIKPLLLDQSFLAGLGNIYVDEALHRAGIHPQANSARLDAGRVRALHGAIRRILSAAIKREGSSFDRFYRTPEGKPGGYQAQFQVYGREGQPCRRCGGTVRRTVVGQRGTHWCRGCQHR